MSVIMLSTYPPLPDEVQEQLDPYNIPVVALDFYITDTFCREISTLGFMLGLEDKADELISFFEEPLGMISEVVSEIPDSERKTVYFEQAATDYGTYGGAGFGCGIPGMIRDAGGIDLYPEIFAESFEADAEDIASRNPDVIVKLQNTGYSLTDTTEFEAVKDSILDRAVFAQTPAVENDEVYVISVDVTGGSRKLIGSMYMTKATLSRTVCGF